MRTAGVREPYEKASSPYETAIKIRSRRTKPLRKGGFAVRDRYQNAGGTPAHSRRTTSDGQDVLRPGRRPVPDPGPRRGGDRLRQPGPRARAVAARLGG